MKERTPTRPQWARVRILLNLLEVPAATAAADLAWKSTRLPQGTKFGRAKVHGIGDMPPGWCYFNPRSRVAVLNYDVWCTHRGSWEIYAFAEQVITMRQSRIVHYDLESWVLLDELSRAEAGCPTMKEIA